jgi:chromosome segregation ATPase
MARPAAHAITDVERIAKQLKSQNKQVTPYRVQKALGGGSFAWVKGALDQLGFQDDAGLPAGIDDATAQLLRLAQPLVDHLTQQARSDMDIAVQRLETTLRETEARLADHEQEISSLRNEIESESEAHRSTREILEAREATISLLEKSLAEAKSNHQADQSQIALLDSKLQDRDAQLASLHNDRQQQREDFAAQRKSLRAEHEATVSRLEKLRRDSVMDASKLRDEAQGLTRENATLVSERQNLQRQCRELEGELAVLNDKLVQAAEAQRIESASQVKTQARLELEAETLIAKLERERADAEHHRDAHKSCQAGLQNHIQQLEKLTTVLPKTAKAQSALNNLIDQARMLSEQEPAS